VKNIKKYITYLVLILICICSFGCSKVNLSVKISSGGVVTQRCEIDLKDLPSNYNNVTNIKAIIKELARKYYQNQLSIAYENKLVGLYNNIYTTDDYKYKYDETDEIIEKTNHEKFSYIISKNIEKYDYETTFIEDNNKIFVEWKFTNIYAYLLYFYPDLIKYDFDSEKIIVDKTHHLLVDVPLNGELETNENLFVETYLQTCHPFYYNGKEPYLLDDCQIQGEDFFKGQTLREVVYLLSGASEEEVEYNFSFSTSYRRLHSNGELSVTEDGYTHTWRFTSLDDSQAIVWRKYVKPAFWYVASLVLGLVVVCGGFLIVVIIKKLKKKRGMKYLNKIANFDKDKK